MNLPGKLRIRALLFSLLAILAATYSGAAEKSAQTVQVKIVAILGSNKNQEFDSRLKSLEQQLKVRNFKSYRLLKEEIQSVIWRENANFEIPGGRSLIVTPQEPKDKEIGLKVRLQEGKKPLVDTTVWLQNKGNFIVAGPPHEGGVLFLAIWATLQ